MRERYELRVTTAAGFALFPAGEGQILSTTGTRKIYIDAHDDRIAAIRMEQNARRKNGKPFLFHGWSVQRTYSKSEINAAELFNVVPTSFFEPEGEFCGTQYDESVACSNCGAGAEQITPLYLPISRIPKSKDFSQTIAGEMVVSQCFVDLFMDHQITGARFVPVEAKRKSPSATTKWYQLHIEGSHANIVPPTLTGLALFELDEKHEFVCSEGDLIGLNPLYEFTISLDNTQVPDIFCAHQYLGARQGVLRPWQPIFVSPKLRALIVAEKPKGLRFEIAHVR